MRESVSFAFVSQSSHLQGGKRLPSSQGNIAFSTNLYYLALQDPMLNPNAKREAGKGKSLYMNLAAINIDPNLEKGVKARLKFFKFRLADNINKIYLGGSVSLAQRRKLANKYQSLSTELDFAKALKETSVLVTGQYYTDNLNPVITKDGKPTDSSMLYLRYLNFTFDHNSLLESFEPALTPVTIGNQKINQYQLTSGAHADGSFSGMTSLQFLRNFGNSKYRNIRKITTKDKNGNEQAFIVGTVGFQDWNKLFNFEKAKFPDEVIKAFDDNKVTTISYNFTFTKNMKHILQMIIDHKQQALMGFIGAVNLDFDKKSHINIYEKKDGTKGATIGVSRISFFKIRNTDSYEKQSENMTQANFESLEDYTPKQSGYEQKHTYAAFPDGKNNVLTKNYDAKNLPF